MALVPMRLMLITLRMVTAGLQRQQHGAIQAIMQAAQADSP